MPGFAANLSMMFTEVPLLNACRSAKSRFDAVEFLFLMTTPPANPAATGANHLTLALFTAPGDNAGEWGLSALPDVSTKHADIDLALNMHWRSIVNKSSVMAGVVPAGEDAERYRAVFIDNLRYAADRCATRQANIGEALSPGVKLIILLQPVSGTGLVEEVARDNVFIQLDTFHAQKVDGNLTFNPHYAGKYAHVQIAGLPDRHEPTMEKSTIRGCSACSMKWDIRLDRL
ncbi:MAG: TIM barrel protein [Enterobacter hormaechei]